MTSFWERIRYPFPLVQNLFYSLVNVIFNRISYWIQFTVHNLCMYVHENSLILNKIWIQIFLGPLNQNLQFVVAMWILQYEPNCFLLWTNSVDLPCEPNYFMWWTNSVISRCDPNSFKFWTNSLISRSERIK